MLFGSNFQRNDVWCSQRPFVIACALPPNWEASAESSGGGGDAGAGTEALTESPAGTPRQKVGRRTDTRHRARESGDARSFSQPERPIEPAHPRVQLPPSLSCLLAFLFMHLSVHTSINLYIYPSLCTHVSIQHLQCMYLSIYSVQGSKHYNDMKYIEGDPLL